MPTYDSGQRGKRSANTYFSMIAVSAIGLVARSFITHGSPYQPIGGVLQVLNRFSGSTLPRGGRRGRICLFAPVPPTPPTMVYSNSPR